MHPRRNDDFRERQTQTASSSRACSSSSAYCVALLPRIDRAWRLDLERQVVKDAPWLHETAEIRRHFAFAKRMNAPLQSARAGARSCCGSLSSIWTRLSRYHRIRHLAADAALPANASQLPLLISELLKMLQIYRQIKNQRKQSFGSLRRGSSRVLSCFWRSNEPLQEQKTPTSQGAKTLGGVSSKCPVQQSARSPVALGSLVLFAAGVCASDSVRSSPSGRRRRAQHVRCN
eukprot:3282428-Pleurochrysis_carterae.AAC.2